MNTFTRVLLILGGIALLCISVFALWRFGLEDIRKILFIVAPFMIGLLSLTIGIKPYGFMKGYEITTDPELLEIISLPMGWGKFSPVGMPQLLLYKNRIAVKNRYFSGWGIGLPFEANYTDIESILFKRKWNYWFRYSLAITTNDGKVYSIEGLNSSDKNKIIDIIKSIRPSIVI